MRSRKLGQWLRTIMPIIVPKWRPLVAGCEQKPLISYATEALGLVAVALSTAGGTKMARNVPRDVLVRPAGLRPGGEDCVEGD